jgi:O-acetyl-ADP-ribose deacetylase (regulator of RNase III)
MQYFLVCRDEELARVWRSEFGHIDNVKIIKGDITEVVCDAIVSPSNSFGFMDGGLDYALSERFGWDLQKTLQQEIQNLPEAELLIGKAHVVPTGDGKIPFLIAAPTMRVPMNFNISTSLNAYLAMKAILIIATAHSKIKTVAIPGLCTGIGKMPVEIAARQMYMAFSEVELGNSPCFEDFGQAQKYHWKLNETGMIYE